MAGEGQLLGIVACQQLRAAAGGALVAGEGGDGVPRRVEAVAAYGKQRRDRRWRLEQRESEEDW